MITIFTCPKPFKGHINIIQRNAIQSWLKLEPGIEILLYGEEEGIKEIAEEFGINPVRDYRNKNRKKCPQISNRVKHIPDIKRNEYGKPYLDSVFNHVQKIARNNILIYVNCDILLFSDIVAAVKKINFPLYLMAGRRQDLKVEKEIDFKSINWENKIKEEVKEKGRLHGYSGIDYFVFQKNFPHYLPSFAVGIVGWDSWLIYNTKRQRIPVIDATASVIAIHQNHDYSHSTFANEKKGRIEGPEMKRNLELAGGFFNMLTLREADWFLTKQGLKKPDFPRNIFSKLALFYFWRLLLSVKRKLQNF